METIAFKSSWKHAVLEELIKGLDPNQDISRSAITNRAICAAKAVTDWKPIRENLLNLERRDVTPPVSMQAKIEEELAQDVNVIRARISEDLKDYLERLQTPYFVQLLWMNYLMGLKEQKMKVGKQFGAPDDLSGPDMVKRLVQILMLNRVSDRVVIEKIKAILLEWEE